MPAPFACQTVVWQAWTKKSFYILARGTVAVNNPRYVVAVGLYDFQHKVSDLFLRGRRTDFGIFIHEKKQSLQVCGNLFCAFRTAAYFNSYLGKTVWQNCQLSSLGCKYLRS